MRHSCRGGRLLPTRTDSSRHDQFQHTLPTGSNTRTGGYKTNPPKPGVFHPFVIFTLADAMSNSDPANAAASEIQIKLVLIYLYLQVF